MAMEQIEAGHSDDDDDDDDVQTNTGSRAGRTGPQNGIAPPPPPQAHTYTPPRLEVFLTVGHINATGGRAGQVGEGRGRGVR